MLSKLKSYTPYNLLILILLPTSLKITSVTILLPPLVLILLPLDVI